MQKNIFEYKGFVKKDDVVMALNKQREYRIQLGKIAIEKELLSMDQVFEILNKQQEAPPQQKKINKNLWNY